MHIAQIVKYSGPARELKIAVSGNWKGVPEGGSLASKLT